MFGTLIDYWYLTGDETYNDVIMQAMIHQATPAGNFMPENQTRTEGNDDQGFWAMSAMSAAENNFPNPPADQPQWVALAQAVFNMYVTRWEPQDCGGGLRWQILPLNQGFNYKNSISNGCFFNIAARLARYTGNQTYADWANKIYQWQTDVKFITSEFWVEDGASTDSQCQQTVPILWSYNAGIYLHGASVMYDVTKDDVWKQRVDGLLASTELIFFNNSIAVEQNCEPFQLCNIDQRSFKGYLLRWLAQTTQLAPHTSEKIIPLLQSSGAAAAKACDGSPTEGFSGIQGTACGQDWTKGTFDGFVGVGEQMNALSALIYTQVKTVAAPVTAGTGGTSEGDPGAGLESDPRQTFSPIEMKDRVAASFLTIAISLGVVTGSWFVMKDEGW
jgi:mannan endo-1,6-alpha-mannosidase